MFYPSDVLLRAVLHRYEVLGLFPPLSTNLADEMYRLLDLVPFAGSPYICTISVASEHEAYLTYATTVFSNSAEFNQDSRWLRTVIDSLNNGHELPQSYPSSLSRSIHYETKQISDSQIARLRREMQDIDALAIRPSGERCERDGRSSYAQIRVDGKTHHFTALGCPKPNKNVAWKDEHIRFFRIMYDIARECLVDNVSKQQIEQLHSWFYGFHRPDKS